MGGLRKVMPWTAGTFLIGCLAIAGFPLMSGFFSKDLILWSAFSNVHVLNIPGVLDQNIGVIDLLTNTAAPAIASGGAVDVSTLATVVGFGVGILGVITAGLTAFYMFRLYFMTFEGDYRGDEETWSHAHESPPVMVIPLAVLALLATVGGWTGWPHFIVHGLHLPEGLLFFEHWYVEIFDTSMKYRIVGRFGAHPYLYEGIATGVSVAVGLTGIFFAHRFYIKQPEVPGNIKERFEKLHQVLTDKYYVDEGYDLAFVKSSIKGGEGLTFFDKNILDGGLVNGAAQILVSAGRILRNMQSGNVQRYATYITLGVVLSLAVLYGWIG
jgi:NADH-quinone oxidoreductase subunit L